MKRTFRAGTFACALSALLLAGAGPAGAQQSGAGSQPTTQPPSGGSRQQPTTGAGEKDVQKMGTSQQSAGADAMFMQRAAMGSMAEIEHGKLAATAASSADVKQFAQRMVTDHSKASEELKAVASGKKVTLPTELDQKHRAMHEKLSKLKGEAFDKAYMSHMVQSHKQSVTLFQQESKSGKDADAKAFAAKTLPVVQEHLKMAQEISSKVGKGAM